MYVGAGVILINSQNQVLLVCDGRSGRWGFPKGHPEKCDHGIPLNTAVRETWEETGLNHAIDYVLDVSKGRRIGKRLYFNGVVKRDIGTAWRAKAQNEEEIRDVRWWSLEEFNGMDDVLNSDLRCWIKKMKNKSPRLNGKSPMLMAKSPLRNCLTGSNNLPPLSIS